MSRQLEIIALEPFYGGVRKDTLDLIAQKSRHKWKLYTLPARRLERRLTTAAQWFHQQMSRTKVRGDVLFTSDAMNLADFVRLNPEYGRRPIIAYFYCNPLATDAAGDQQARLAMLSTALCCSETWFNSLFHMREFLSNAAALYDRHPELGGKEPLRALVGKAQLMHPPIQAAPPAKNADEVDAERKGRTLCIDNRRGAPTTLFLQVISKINERKEPVAVHVLGPPIEHLPEGVPTTAVDPKNDADVAKMLRRCELFVTGRSADTFDPLAMRAMMLGCIPVLPKVGFFSEFIPKPLHAWCVYDSNPDDLVSRIMDLWYLRRPAVTRRELDEMFERYTPATAMKRFDDRIEMLASQLVA